MNEYLNTTLFVSALIITTNRFKYLTNNVEYKHCDFINYD